MSNTFELPSNWDGGAITLTGRFTLGSGASNADQFVFQADAFCLAGGSAVSATGATYNAGTPTTIIIGNGGYTSATNTAQPKFTLNVPITGCSAGDTMTVRLKSAGTPARTASVNLFLARITALGYLQ
jgi:hypothetical protein